MLDIAKEITDEIIKELLSGTESIMSASGLGNSELIKDIDWVFEDQSFKLVTDRSYFKYVDQGRKKFARKVPIEALIKWIKKKGIRPRNGQTINSLAFAIQNGIYKSGIKGKRYVDTIVEFSLNTILEYIVVDFTITAAEEISRELERLELSVKI